MRACATNYGFYGSDHRAVKLTLNHVKWIKKSTPKKQFIFESKWLLEDKFTEKVKQSWENTKNARSLPEKLKECDDSLQNWASQEVGNTNKKIKMLMQELEKLQDEDWIEGEENLITKKEKELERLINQEEIYWQQRAKKTMVECRRCQHCIFSQMH